MRRSVGGALGVAALAAVVLSCRQIVGIQDSPPTASTDACGLQFGTSACASCASKNCCTESSACATDPTCAPYESCFGGCKGDPRCQVQCEIDHPSASADVSTLSVCLASKCEADCNLTCGGFAGRPTEPSTAAACQKCLTTTGCAQARACATSVDCDAINRSCDYAACGATVDCRETCELAHGWDSSFLWKPDGGSGGKTGAFLAAWNSCGDACSAGSDWLCAGRVTWPSVTSTRTTPLHLWVRDAVSGSWLAGVNVEVCAQLDTDCTIMPYASATTDSSGEASLSFQNTQGVGGQQDLGLVGFLKITASDNSIAEYLYPGFPVSSPEYQFYTNVATRAEAQQLATAWHVTPDPNRGNVVVAAFDCDDGAAKGVQVTLSTADALTVANTVNGIATTVTDQTGIIVFGNVPVGAFQVTITAPGVAKPVSQVSADVRAGTGTIVYAYPTP